MPLPSRVSIRRSLAVTPQSRPLLGPARIALLGKVAEGVTLVGLVTVVPRALGHDRYGRFALATSLVSLAALLLAIGGPTLSSRLLPALPRAERPAMALALLRRVTFTRTAAYALLALIAIAAALVAPESVPLGLALLALAAVALESAGTVLTQVGLGLGHSTLWSFRYPLQNSALIVLVLLLPHRTGWALTAVAAASAAGLILSLVQVAPALAAAPRGAEVPAGWRHFGVQTAIAGGLLQTYCRAPVAAVALLGASSAQTGYAGLALGLALGGVYTVMQTATVQLPLLARGTPAPARAGAEATARRQAWSMLALATVGSVLGAVVLRRALPSIIGSGFTGVLPAIGPALACVPLTVPVALLGQVAALRLRPRERIWSNAAGLAAFVAAALLLIPAHEAVGGLAAFAAALAVTGAAGVALLPGGVGAPLLLAALGSGALTWGVAALAAG
jgi:hypothetical protein